MCDSLGRQSQVGVTMPQCKSRSDDGFQWAPRIPVDLGSMDGIAGVQASVAVTDATANDRIAK
jgi:hypothetical protein